MAGTVVVFDFDKTIIDCDSDNWVVDGLGATELFERLRPTMPWNTLMVDAILDKESFNLEELLDEEEIIQECRALNSRLINFLRDRVQVEQLLRYIVDDAPDDADTRRTFKFPFIACEIFACEIDVILRTLVEDEELMHLLFSFLEPSRQHGSLLAGYFSKVAMCLMLRKTNSFMNYVQVHNYILQQLIHLIGIKSIMEVLVRLVGAGNHMYPNFLDVMQWLADSNLLEMIVDKLSPLCPPEVHANAADVLRAITHTAPSSLATKLSSQSFVSRIFDHALADTNSKSSLIHSLSVSISLLDSRRSESTALVHSNKTQTSYEPQILVDSETVAAMLPKLDHLLSLLNVSADECSLPTTYGELRPPLGKHRLKIVEFIAVLLGTGNEAARSALVGSGAIQRVMDLFFEYPFNNSLHHHVENVILSCLICADTAVIDHLFCNCNMIKRFLSVDQSPLCYSDSGQANYPTLPASQKQPPRAGNIGHITKIANKLVQLSSRNDQIRSYLQENNEWVDWQTNVLHERNTVENVYRWICGRPSTLQERMKDSDDDELHEKDYDIAALTNNFSNTLRYNIYKNHDADEVQGSLDHDDEGVFFDDESSEVIVSSLRFGDNQDRSCLFTNSDWFAFKEDKISEAPSNASTIDEMGEVDLTDMRSDSNCSNDEVVTGEGDEVGNFVGSVVGTSRSSRHLVNKVIENRLVDYPTGSEVASLSPDGGIFELEAQQAEDLFDDNQLPDWVGWRQPSDIQIDTSTVDDFHHPDSVLPGMNTNSNDTVLNISSGSTSGGGQAEVEAGTSSFEDDVEFVGVDSEGVERGAERWSPDGRPGGEVRLSTRTASKISEASMDPGRDVSSRLLEFHEINYWRVEQEAGIVKE